MRDRINQSMKEAMKSGDKKRLSTMRLILVAPASLSVDATSGSMPFRMQQKRSESRRARNSSSNGTLTETRCKGPPSTPRGRWLPGVGSAFANACSTPVDLEFGPSAAGDLTSLGDRLFLRREGGGDSQRPRLHDALAIAIGHDVPALSLSCHEETGLKAP